MKNSGKKKESLLPQSPLDAVIDKETMAEAIEKGYANDRNPWNQLAKDVWANDNYVNIAHTKRAEHMHGLLIWTRIAIKEQHEDHKFLETIAVVAMVLEHFCTDEALEGITQ